MHMHRQQDFRSTNLETAQYFWSKVFGLLSRRGAVTIEEISPLPGRLLESRMRQILLILIVLGLSATGLAVPFIGLCGYIWFGLMRPDVLAWIEERTWFSMMLALSTLVGGLRHIALWPYQVLQNPLVWPVIALQAPI